MVGWLRAPDHTVQQPAVGILVDGPGCTLSSSACPSARGTGLVAVYTPTAAAVHSGPARSARPDHPRSSRLTQSGRTSNCPGSSSLPARLRSCRQRVRTSSTATGAASTTAALVGTGCRPRYGRRAHFPGVDLGRPCQGPTDLPTPTGPGSAGPELRRPGRRRENRAEPIRTATPGTRIEQEPSRTTRPPPGAEKSQPTPAPPAPHSPPPPQPNPTPTQPNPAGPPPRGGFMIVEQFASNSTAKCPRSLSAP